MEISGYVRSDNKITSKISIKGATCWVGDEEQQFDNVSPDRQSNSPVRIILQTKKADELYDRALKYGATEICPMTTEDDWRMLKDPVRHLWEIGYIL